MHGEHATAPFSRLKKPTAHFEHVELPLLPAGQLEQDVSTSVSTICELPAAGPEVQQASQLEAPAAAYVPPSHMVQIEAPPLGAKRPGAHCSHFEADAAPAAEPAAHGVQVRAPALENEPAAQASHVLAPAFA